MKIINKNPSAELKNTFHRTESSHKHQISSPKGRGVCLLMILPHLGGIVAKPLLYTGLAVKEFAVGTFKLFIKLIPHSGQISRRASAHFKQGLGYSGNVIVAPLGQIVQLFKAILGGVVHPGAYFKSNSIPLTEEEEAILIILNHPHVPSRGSVPWISFYLQCERSSFAEHPDHSLHELAGNIVSKKATDFKIQFNGEPGQDIGGLRRNYMLDLFSALSTKHQLLKEIVPFTNENERVLTDIGHVFKMLTQGLLYRGTNPQSIVTGEVFHSSYFKGILNFTHKELSHPFEVLLKDKERVLEMMITSSTDKESLTLFQNIQNFCQWDGSKENKAKHKKLIRELRDNNFYDFNGLEKNIGRITPDDLGKIKAIMIDNIIIDHQAKIKSLYTMAKAMDYSREEWNELRDLGRLRLQVQVQGGFNKGLLLERLDFDYDYCNGDLMAIGSAQAQEVVIRDWMAAQTPRRLQIFLYNTTGSTSVPLKRLTFRFNTFGTPPAIHTCSQTIDLPANFRREDGSLVDFLNDTAAQKHGTFTQG